MRGRLLHDFVIGYCLRGKHAGSTISSSEDANASTKSSWRQEIDGHRLRCRVDRRARLSPLKSAAWTVRAGELVIAISCPAEHVEVAYQGPRSTERRGARTRRPCLGLAARCPSDDHVVKKILVRRDLVET